jgi:MoaA/NifB/PqqE/SkfB family radical SAM enzyme
VRSAVDRLDRWSTDQLHARRYRANAKRLASELRQRKVWLQSHPTTLILEPVTACNLAYPFCPTGGGYGRLPREILRPETFRRIVAHLRCELLDTVLLYNWGEPLLNPHLGDYIHFFSRKHKRTVVSTNFSARDYDDGTLETLVASGLSELIVSVDGATQDAYARYRRGGNLERVLANMERLARAKRRLGVSYPHVVYQMLVHRFNAHQIEEARKLATERSAEFRASTHFWCPDHERERWLVPATPAPSAGHESALPPAELPPNEDAEAPPDPAPDHRASTDLSAYCRQLWEMVIVNANGDVFPCCITFQPEHAVANLARDDISAIRNHTKLVYLRRFVLDPYLPAPRFESHCTGCTERRCRRGAETLEAGDARMARL